MEKQVEMKENYRDAEMQCGLQSNREAVGSLKDKTENYGKKQKWRGFPVTTEKGNE